ncbi:MAG: hypothetical protein WCJ02_15660, partial [bacterium]
MNARPIALNSKRTGSTMIVVMGMTLLGTFAAGSIISSVLARLNQGDKQVCLEQAFYIASAGAERAATFVAAGSDTSTTLNGTLGTGSYVANIVATPGASGECNIDVTSVGTVKGVQHTVTMQGLRRVSWARYALWYDSEALTLWMGAGEKFGGRVYAKPQLRFDNTDLATKGQVRFSDQVWSGASSITLATGTAPVFEKGLALSATMETMASVDFASLLTVATAAGLVLEGPTTIVLDGTTMKITNTRKKWSNQVVSIPANGTVYVKTATSGKDTKTGDIDVSAPLGLGSRLTLVSDHDINIVDHVRYKTNPQTDPTSTDALGLIAKHDVVVQPAAPNNVDIYAHIICQTGGFGVYNYSSGSYRGDLNVYGGIVNLVRNAVGQIGRSGYSKNYIFDVRFAKTPPPNYPV